MDKIRIAPMPGNPAVAFAARELERQGLTLVEQKEDATHLLLPVPSPAMETKELPEGITLIGGNLKSFPEGYSKVDLLRDEIYLVENAALTADCAIRLLGQHLQITLRNCPVLVIGWGRIGKCLAALLRGNGARVCVAARKASDRGMLTALGYDCVEVSRMQPADYCAILNTVPAPVMAATADKAVKIDLASVRGMDGQDVIWARGLPGKMLPESSGKLIAQRVLKLLGEEGK